MCYIWKHWAIKALKLNLAEPKIIFASMNYICHLFLFFSFYFRGNYLLILRHFAKNTSSLVINISVKYQWKTQYKLYHYQNFYLKFSVLVSSKPALIFGQNRIEENVNLIINASFIHFRYVGLDTHWPIFIFRISLFLFIDWSHIG